MCMNVCRCLFVCFVLYCIVCIVLCARVSELATLHHPFLSQITNDKQRHVHNNTPLEKGRINQERRVDITVSCMLYGVASFVGGFDRSKGTKLKIAKIALVHCHTSETETKRPPRWRRQRSHTLTTQRRRSTSRRRPERRTRYYVRAHQTSQSEISLPIHRLTLRSLVSRSPFPLSLSPLLSFAL